MTAQSLGATLSGTLSTPAQDSKGVIVMIHGSGPLDRDQNTRGASLNTFSDLAARLDEAGYASLRWDKRGVGASGGSYETHGQADLVADVQAWLPQVRGLGPIYLLGHSEGTALAPQAAMGQDVSGLILICPYITSGEEILMRQGARSDEWIAAMPGIKGWLTRVLSMVLGRPSVLQRKVITRLKTTTTDTIRIGIKRRPARWLRDFVTADLPAIHRANTRPTLVIGAEFDLQCPPQDAATIAALNPRAEHIEIKALSHLLRETRSADLADYPRQLGEPNDPRVAETILDWLDRQPAD